MHSTDTHYLGLWWNPLNPEKQYYGTLFIEENSVHLELLFLQEDLSDMKYQRFARSFIDSNTNTIHGCLGGLKPRPVTLFDVNFLDYERQQLNVLHDGKFYINAKNVFFDKLIKSAEEKVFSKIDIYLTHLNDWIRPEFPKLFHNENEENGVTFKYSDPYLFYEKDDLKIYINKSFTQNKTFGNAFEYSLKYIPYVTIQSTAKVSYKESIDILEDIKTFMMACMRCHPIVEDYKPYFESEPLSHECFLTVTQHPEKRFTLYKQYADFKNFKTAFENWQKYFHNDRNNFYMFIDLLDNTKNLQEDRKCEQLVQIIEGLYKAQGKDKIEITEAHFDLFGCTEKQKKDFIKNGNKTSMLFAKLVKTLMEEKTEHFKPDFEKIYERSDDEIFVRFIKAANGFRNFYSHGATDNLKLDTLHPYYLNSILLKAVRLILIQDIIGIKQVEIELEDL